VQLEILYDFRVDISPSKIPNAGLGAFLTFLGARHLKDEAYGKKGPKLTQKKLELEDTLEALGERGHGIHVRLAGEAIDERKAVSPEGIGPEREYTESDYEPSPTTVFSSRGQHNGLIRKSSVTRYSCNAHPLTIRTTFDLRSRSVWSISTPRQKTNLPL
jgi:hypothetical protein